MNINARPADWRKRLIGFSFLAILGFSRCAADSYFDRLSSGFFLGTQVVPARNPGVPNTASVASIAPFIKRVELLSRPTVQRGTVIFERPVSELSLQDVAYVPVSPKNYDVLLSSTNTLSAGASYAKVYFYGVAFKLTMTNFNQSQAADVQETFFNFYNSVRIDGLVFASGDTAAVNKSSGRIEFIDTAKASQTPLSPTPAAKYSVGVGGMGQDEFGSYALVPVAGMQPSADKVLLILMIFDGTEKFSWTDSASAPGVFDGASQDVFHWQFGFPLSRIEISEM